MTEVQTVITGIIAAIILIAVLPPAIGNGETGVIIVAVVAALFLLAFGAASRESDRAYLNHIDYWAKGGPDRERDATPKKTREQEMREAAKSEREHIRIKGMWQEGDGYCPACGGKVGLAARIRDNGVKKNLYMCERCGRTYKGNPIE